MNEQIVQAENVFDLFALFSSYILEHINQYSYEFYDFDDDNYNSVYVAVGKYISDINDKGHKCAVNNLKKFILKFFNNQFSIEKCYAASLSMIWLSMKLGIVYLNTKNLFSIIQ